MALGLSINKLEAACAAGSDAAFTRELEAHATADVRNKPAPKV